ncbi:dUTP diphosphatase [Alteribacter natronophilus]|uniref:dUTP diphosphatase n=1 Tax=Alteribacter natronophilus TaxID=2583810 RepID=UPI00110F0E87|nr:dUTP diphosphatase [Alteribacter natronophilus]TMW71665.1 dUTPase [Alteribacter natronophilus]
MTFTRLFEMQKALDRHIEQSKGLADEDLLDRKFLAFHVELGELANETRCFKFWSSKPPSPQEVILEEYVDGVHFLMSIGIELGFDDDTGRTYRQAESESGEALADRFNSVIQAVESVRQTRTREAYTRFFDSYTALGSALGFSGEEVENAYLKKNEVNYERQRKGY